MNLEDEISLRGRVDDLIAIPLLQCAEELAVAAVRAAGERVEVVCAAAVCDKDGVGGGDLRRDRCWTSDASLLGPS